MPGRGIPSGREVQMRLYRDSLHTPWGFRLQGGRDLNSSLVVQKVTPCTPSDGELQRGDVLLEIQSNDATKMTHVQAQELIRKAGGSLLLRLVRTGHVEFIPAPSVPALSQPSRPPPTRRIPAPVNRDVGTDYNRRQYTGGGVAAPLSPSRDYNPQSGFMLNRVQDSLNHSLWSGTGSPTTSLNSPGYHDNYSSPWVLSASSAATPSYPPWQAQAPAPSASSLISRHSSSPARHRVNDGVGEAPAWLGSLRSSEQPLVFDSHAGKIAGIGGGDAPPQPHAPRIQGVHYGPDGTPRYKQSAAEGVESDTARAVHLQYNSPLGLYSKASAQEAMSGQLNGRAGQGTIGITTDTEVQRMIREENGSARGGGLNAPSSGEPIRQSPSIRALETKFVEAGGISDF